MCCFHSVFHWLVLYLFEMGRGEAWPGPSSFLFLSVSFFLIQRQVDSGAMLWPEMAWSQQQEALGNSSLACGLVPFPPPLMRWPFVFIYWEVPPRLHLYRA